MKVVTIFSGKGGVGKTTTSVMLGSWLKYEKGERVVAYDFESPEARMMNLRKRDLDFLKNNSPTLTALVGDNKDFYPMGAIRGTSNGYTERELLVIAEKIKKAKETGPGYIICDFPGRFEPKEAVYTLTRQGLIDLIVFPLQPEEQSITSMMIINKHISEPGFIVKPDGPKQQLLCFWNMITQNDRRAKVDFLLPYENLMKAMNIPISQTRINFVDSVKRSPNFSSMVTSTVCYPKKNILRAFPPKDGGDRPYIEDLFQEIKDRLDAM